MSMSPVFSAVSAPRVSPLTHAPVVAGPVSPPPPGALTQTLQRFLSLSVTRRLDWRHSRRREQADVVEETFVAEDAEARVELKASRREAPSREQGEPETPRRLLRWQVTVQIAGQKPRALDGRDLALPAAAPDATVNPAEQTIARLFRIAFERVIRGFDALLAPLRALADGLRLGAIQSCYSFIRPSMGNPLGAAEILQVAGSADGQPASLEIARFLGQRQITIRFSGRVAKVGEKALENASVRESIGQIEALAAAQRAGRRKTGA
ncbi:MAG: hypothetical protein IPK79_02545 [Vampirovibrionales bacterium]|nr:hypothetical protein [Vampirovibrionales bacterium]